MTANLFSVFFFYTNKTKSKKMLIMPPTLCPWLAWCAMRIRWWACKWVPDPDFNDAAMVDSSNSNRMTPAYNSHTHMHAQHAVSIKGLWSSAEVIVPRSKVKQVIVPRSKVKQDVAYSMDKQIFLAHTHTQQKEKREKTKRKSGGGKAKNKNSKV